MSEILMFHRILPAHFIDKNDPYFLKGTLISTNRFESVLMDYLNKGYSFRTISKLSKSNREKIVSLTFDDGYADNFQYALPILEKYSLKATFYPIIRYCLSQDVAPLDHYYQHVKSNINPVNYNEWVEGRIKQEFLALSVSNQRKYIINLKGIKSKPDVQYMTHNQLKALYEIGHEIGAHSYQHDIYTLLTDDEIQDDITSTIRGFKSIELSPTSFAYPDGRYNERIITRIKNSGFYNACTVKSQYYNKDAQFELERKFVTENEII
ncbi:polysaccharide deacetylase family protein [bacterium]|jgi:peptidoglycan/xylan/chitin deacetylase (PgdA/CDA1 family)|nr:polysaccharide deacetylase family protein [Crocinitomicaceae bacterium]MDA9020490.1 polysaccharide deacetylase family protein [bacterium]MDC0459619.1 polysaccharide deacetylase family protein [Crocinitomicaceae bacterium]